MSMKDITLGRYVFGSSFLHRLDPRTKLISLLMLMTGLFTGNSWESVGCAVLFSGAACLSSGLKPSYLAKSLLPFKWLIIFTVILNIIFVGGHILVEAPLPFGGITIEGLNYGFMYGARIAILVLTASLLTLTTEPIVFVDGIEKLLSPLRVFKLNSHEVAISMVITIRFIPILLDEAVKIRKSHTARGLTNEGGLMVKLKSVSHLLLPLFTSAVRRAETLAMAMECRLYRSEVIRSRYNEIKMARHDWLVLILSLAFTIIMVMV